MALQLITPHEFAGKRWRRQQGYGFARSVQVVPVGLAELVRANGTLPLAFVKRADRYELVALLSLVSGTNAFVGPSGQWLGRYVPAALRGHPFNLRPNAGQPGQWGLGFDDASGLLAAADEAETEPFFDDAGQPVPALRAIADFLALRNASYLKAHAATLALERAGLIEPWTEIVLPGAPKGSIQGLYRINAKAFDALDDAAFLDLRRANALPIAWSQLGAAAVLPVLEELRALRERMDAATLASRQTAAGAGLKGINVSVEDGQFKFD